MSTATPRPQLNSDEMRRLKWLLGGLVALVSLWTVFFLDVEALALVVGTSLAVLATLIWPQLPAHIPKLIWKLSVPAIVIAVGIDFYINTDILPMLIRLAVLLVFYRAVSYRRKREDLQLLVLGLFLVVIAGVLTVSLEFAFLLLLFTACALGFLFSVTLIDMTDTGPKVMRPEEMSDVPGWAKLGWGSFFVRLRQVFDWKLAGFASALFIVVVGFSAVLFVVIPRFELGNSFILDKYITRKTRTGFSEKVKFGDVSELVRDDSMAMRIDLTDAASLQEVPYWRLIVLDEYTPQGFQMSAGLKQKLGEKPKTRQIIAGRQGLLPAARLVGGRWTFYVEPEVSRFLPLPGSFSTLRMREPMPMQVSKEQQLFALRSESMAMSAFQLDGVELSSKIPDPAFAQQLKDRGHSESTTVYNQRVTLLGPTGITNVTILNRIAGEITAGGGRDAVRFSQLASDWLRKKHSYALSFRIPPGPQEMDDIVKWLDSNEPGFCEHFAASLTVLCRAAGYPARVVAGFHGGTLNAFENYYMVKNSDAHAWAEVFDGTGEWFRVDATPGAINRIAASAESETREVRQQKSDHSWTARFDSLRVIWYRRIVSFDAQQQVEMIQEVKAFTFDTSAAFRKRMDNLTKMVKAWLAGPWDFARTGKIFQLLAAVVVLVWAFVRAWYWSRLAWRMWGRAGNYDPVRAEAGRWLGKFGQKGTSNAEPNESVERVQRDLLRLRYGPRETWPDPREVFRRARQAGRSSKNQPTQGRADGVA